MVLLLLVVFLFVAGIYHIGSFNFSIMERTAAIGVIGVALLMSLIALIFILARQQKLKLLQLNRDNELLLDDLIHHQPSGIYRIALNTDQIKEPLEVKDIQSMDSLPVRYIFVSKQHETITGISAEELYESSQAIFDAIYPDDRASFYTSNLESIREVKRFKWEGRMVAHGQIKWVSFDSLPRLNPPGQIIWTGVAIDITTQKEMELEMENREAFERLITRLSSSFVNVNIENADSIIQSALSAVGNFCGTDRAYIFSFHEDGVHASNTYEWCAEGINPQIGELQGLDMTSMPQWIRMLNEFKCIDVFDVKDLPESWSIEKQILEPQGIKSLIVVPIYSAKKLFGFVGFDSVKQNRKWKEYEVQLLKVFADLLHTAFERQSSETSINEYQQMLRTVLETIKVRVFWKDKDLIFKGCNEAFAIDAGFSDPEDIIGKDDFQMAWNEQAEKYRADDVLVMSTGKPMLNIEEQQTQADGTIKWVNVTKVPLRNLAGKIVGILGTYQDITGQKLYKDALEASERKYRILTEKAFDGIYLLRKKTFEYVNQRFCDLTGYSYDELIHPEFDNLSLFTPESKQMAVERLKARAGGYDLPSTYEMEIITRLGQPRLVEISTNKLNDAGEENLILGIMRDITERKKIEKLTSQVAVANQAAQFKQNFLANMSHEIRTPLTGVLGMIELLSKTALDTNQIDYVNTLKHSTENLREIINQILDYSKIEAGQVKLRQEIFETDTLFRNARKLFQNTCQKDVDFFVETDTYLPSYIKADQHRLSQVINNLVSNAIKFTHKGSITLWAGLEKELEKDYAILKISVKDTGIGVKKSALKNLFKPFEQIDHEDKRHFEGTGLGLSICKELVALMYGDIGVESEQGTGSLFWFTFRAKRVDKPLIKNSSDIKQEMPVNPSLKILFAEDKVVNQKVVSLLLKGLGHTVTLASNGLEALEIYSKGDFDLILMDIQMPEIDGISATKILKEQYADLPPVVGLSANAFEGDREKYMAQGLDEYITKPIKGEDLKMIINKLINP